MWQLPPDAITTAAEAAKYLKRNYWTFRACWREYNVPHTMIGGRPVFFKSELDAWNAKNGHLMKQREAA